MDTLRITHIGEPVTKGSVTAFVPRKKDGSYATRPNGSPLVVKHDDTGDRGKTDALQLGMAALQARQRAGMELLRGQNVEIAIHFYKQRGKGHYGTGRNAKLLKPSAPARPGTKPDVDKLVRHVLDALKGVIYADDSQVVTLMASKHYGDPARTEIEITICATQTVEDEALAPQMELVA